MVKLKLEVVEWASLNGLDKKIISQGWKSDFGRFNISFYWDCDTPTRE